MTETQASSTSRLTGLLINNQARRSVRAHDLLIQVLARHEIDVGPIVWVDHPDRLMTAIDGLLEQGVDNLIVGGGDGTLSTVASRLMHRNVTLGVLPLGTANDFARTLGIPVNLDGAAQVIASGNVRLVDLGRANDAIFLNVASLGMSVLSTAELSAGIKRWFGLFAYLYAGARAFTRNPTFRCRVWDQLGSVEATAHQIVVGNGRYYGGGVLVARESSLEDGLLHAYGLGALGRWNLLRTIALLRMGVPIERPGDFFLQTPSLQVETCPELDVNCDGEIRTKTPVRFTVEPRALRVFAP